MSIHYDDPNPHYEPAAPANDSGRYTLTEEFARFLRHAERVQGDAPAEGSLREWLDLAEAWRITQALGECKGNRSAAARKLGIGRRTLYAKMDKLGITPTWSF